MSAETELVRMAGALPEKFDFYHLGTVAPAPDLGSIESELEIRPEQLLWESLDEDTKVAFTIRGDLSGVLVISFESGLDVSTYMEIGNIIASRTVTRLSDEEGMDLMISPPQLLSRRGLERLAQASSPGSIVHRIYLHRHDEQTHAVQAFLIATKGEGLLDV